MPLGKIVDRLKKGQAPPIGEIPETLQQVLVSSGKKGPGARAYTDYDRKEKVVEFEGHPSHKAEGGLYSACFMMWRTD